MKRCIEGIAAIRNLPLFGHRPLVLVLQCLGFEFGSAIHGVTGPVIGGIWTTVINGTDSERSEFINTSIELLRGLIADYFSRPRLDRYIRSGVHLAVRPT